MSAAESDVPVGGDFGRLQFDGLHAAVIGVFQRYLDPRNVVLTLSRPSTSSASGAPRTAERTARSEQ